MPDIASDEGSVRGARRRWLPRPTIRLRLTLLYGGLFLAAGAALLAITYGLVAHSTAQAVGDKNMLVVKGRPVAAPLPGLPPPKALGYATATGAGGVTFQLRQYAGQVSSAAQIEIQRLDTAQRAQLDQLQRRAKAQIANQRSAQLRALLTRSGVALVIMAFVSIGLGWLMAGRALRPVRTMNARARGISERNLHERLALDGRDDEFKELGDTFDGLLGRLEKAFESQRRFVANASHELRTPITLERTLVEVALADPQASAASLRSTCERVLSATEQQERLINALLLLARSQRGLDKREQLDLAAVVGEALRGVEPNGIRLESELATAPTSGDPALVERLVANLLDNALHYNRPSGWAKAWTGLRDGEPTLELSNSGPVIEAREVERLWEPFQRCNGGLPDDRRNGGPRGLGLGLSIVDAIADAHGARLTATPLAAGGLRVAVAFRPVGASH
ncbi:MAG: HAMP domain-containing protein [Solirubrobacterales bacterium]|nr:HAMP domain-containing protein [Solirubrobacterales bacterium]